MQDISDAQFGGATLLLKIIENNTKQEKTTTAWEGYMEYLYMEYANQE